MNHTIRKFAIGALVFALAIVCLVPALNAHAARASYTFSEITYVKNPTNNKNQRCDYSSQAVMVDPSSKRFYPLGNYNNVNGWQIYNNTGSNTNTSNNTKTSWNTTNVNTIKNRMKALENSGFSMSTNSYSYSGSTDQTYFIGSTSDKNFSNIDVYIPLSYSYALANVSVKGADYCQIRLCDENKKPITTLESSTTRNVSYALSSGNYYLQIANLKGKVVEISITYTSTIHVCSNDKSTATFIFDKYNSTKTHATSIQSSRGTKPCLFETVNDYKTANWYSFLAQSGTTTLYYTGEVESGNVKIEVYDPAGKLVKTTTCPANLSIGTIKSLNINTSSGMGRTWYVKITPTTSYTNGIFGISVK